MSIRLPIMALAFSGRLDPHYFPYGSEKNPLRPEDINVNIKKIVPRGCKVYNINGVEIIALNEKSAIRKYNKLK